MSSILNEPIPLTSANLRPFVNKDVTNDVAYKHGLPRPMKHYRLGVINAVTIDPNSSDANYLTTNVNRYVRSSRTAPLLSLTMERPGHVFESTSNVNFGNDLSKDTRFDGLLKNACPSLKSESKLDPGVECLKPENKVNIVSSDGNKYVFNSIFYDSKKVYGLTKGTYIFKNVPSTHPMALLNRYKKETITYKGDEDKKIGRLLEESFPNDYYNFYHGDITVEVTGDFGELSVYCYYHGYMGGKDLLKYSDGCKDNEEIESIKPTNVCNQEKNALNRARGSNTNLSKNYYQTSQQYRHSRCNTIQQKGYQYSNSGNGEYVSNCSNEGCNKVIYKPSNAQFATQGGVSSSSRTSRLTLNTIKTEANNYKNKATADNYTNIGAVVTTPFILKAKTSGAGFCKPSKVCP